MADLKMIGRIALEHADCVEIAYRYRHPMPQAENSQFCVMRAIEDNEDAIRQYNNIVPLATLAEWAGMYSESENSLSTRMACIAATKLGIPRDFKRDGGVLSTDRYISQQTVNNIKNILAIWEESNKCEANSKVSKGDLLHIGRRALSDDDCYDIARFYLYSSAPSTHSQLIVLRLIDDYADDIRARNHIVDIAQIITWAREYDPLLTNALRIGRACTNMGIPLISTTSSIRNVTHRLITDHTICNAYRIIMHMGNLQDTSSYVQEF